MLHRRKHVYPSGLVAMNDQISNGLVLQDASTICGREFKPNLSLANQDDSYEHGGGIVGGRSM